MHFMAIVLNPNKDNYNVIILITSNCFRNVIYEYKYIVKQTGLLRAYGRIDGG